MPSITNVGSTKIKIPYRALEFNGYLQSGGYCRTNTQTTNTLSNNMTFAAWCKPYAVTGNISNHYIFDMRCNNDAGNGAAYGYCAWGVDLVRSSRRFRAHFTYAGGTPGSLNVTSDDQYTEIPNDGSGPADKWYHVCGVRDGTGGYGYLYVDGVCVGSGSLGHTTTGGLQEEGYVYIGGLGDGPSGPFSGAVGNVKFYSGVAMTATEVAKLYGTGYVGYDDNLVIETRYAEKTSGSPNQFENTGVGSMIFLWVSGESTGGGWMQSPDWISRDVRCWCTRWDEGNWDVKFETFIDGCDRSTIFSNVIPGAVSEQMNILGTPTFIDSTYSSSNTLILSPISNYGLSSVRQERMIAVSNIRDAFLTKDKLTMKIEGKRINE